MEPPEHEPGAEADGLTSYPREDVDSEPDESNDVFEEDETGASSGADVGADSTASRELKRAVSVRVSEVENNLTMGEVDAEAVPGLLGAAAAEQRDAEMAELVAAAESRDKLESARARRVKLPPASSSPSLVDRLSRGAKEVAREASGKIKPVLSRPSLKQVRQRLTRDTLAIKVDKLDLVGRLLAYRSTSGQTFQEKLGAELKAVDVKLPTITVQYNDFSITANAKKGDSISNVANTITSNLKRQESVNKKILNGVSGVLRPGRATLLMGPPGGGKSVFMKALSGRIKESKDLTFTGDLFYNGHRQDEFRIENSSAYVEQMDNHFPTLTVRETLEFAKQCQRGVGEGSIVKTVKLLLASRRKRNLSAAAGGSSMSSAYSATDLVFENLLHELNSSGTVVVDYVLKLMGIDGCQDTVVGDAMLRGVSGGQKKRVTTAEMLVGFTQLLLMDEISTGLDSATTFQVALFITNYTHAMSCTTVVGLLQPPPETVALFDDILIIAEGKIVYHGPTAETLPFFESLGFTCPSRKDMGTFLQELFTPQGQVEYMQGDRKTDSMDELLLSVDQMAGAFWASDTGKALQAEAADTVDRGLSHPDALRKQKYALNPWEAFMVLFNRQVLLLKRNTNLIYTRAGFAIITGLILGTVFFQLEPTLGESRSYFGLFYLICMYLALGNLPQVAITFNAKNIFFKHKNNNFFPAWIYVLVQLMVHIPFALAESLIFGICMYFLSGLSTTSAKYFFIWFVIAFSTHVSMATMFRFIANISPSMVRASSIASLALLINVLTSGYTIVYGDIPPWWIWLYWISPFAYAIRAFVINEMTAPRWEMRGVVALEGFDFFTESWWIWAGVGFQWAFTIVVVMLSSLTLTYLDTRSAHQVRISDRQRDQAMAQARSEFRRAKLQLKELQKELKSGPTSPGPNAVAIKMPTTASGPIPFAPVSLIWRDLKYVVKTPSGAKLELLKGISGFGRPRRLTALMGGSGAGKTTLMDVISGRKTQGEIQGDLLVNGAPKNQASFSRIMGYVEQTDIHSPQATVREALSFSAALRLPADTSDMQRDQLVQDVIKMVELDSLQDQLVGVPGLTGLSGEQRKRLTIAVELVSNPSVVFLDEPTSGLDATAASVVVRTMRTISEAGRTVMATIHQPSIEIFAAFDALVLLKRGGRLIFFGELGEACSNLINYLEDQPGVPNILDGYNPATWMLEVSGGDVEVNGVVKDFANLYEESELKAANDAEVENEITASQSAPKIDGSGAKSVPLGRQFVFLLRKNFRTYWRSPSYNITRMIVIAVMGAMYGSIYWQQGTAITATSIDENRVQNLLGVIFSSITFVAVFQLTAVQPIVAYERSVYTRESAANMYSVWPQSLAQVLVELPFLVVQALIFVPILYFMVGFVPDAGKFFFFLLVNLASLSLFTLFGEWLVMVTPNQQLAQVFGAGLNQVWNIMCGFLVAFPLIPAWWQWANRATPSTWLIYCIAASQMGDSQAVVKAVLPGDERPLGDYLAANFGYEYSFRWPSLGIALLFILFFRITSTLALRYINFANR